jgi:hypothetical protein
MFPGFEGPSLGVENVAPPATAITSDLAGTQTHPVKKNRLSFDEVAGATAESPRSKFQQAPETFFCLAQDIQIPVQAA